MVQGWRCRRPEAAGGVEQVRLPEAGDRRGLPCARNMAPALLFVVSDLSWRRGSSTVAGTGGVRSGRCGEAGQMSHISCSLLRKVGLAQVARPAGGRSRVRPPAAVAVVHEPLSIRVDLPTLPGASPWRGRRRPSPSHRKPARKHGPVGAGRVRFSVQTSVDEGGCRGRRPVSNPRTAPSALRSTTSGADRWWRPVPWPPAGRSGFGAERAVRTRQEHHGGRSCAVDTGDAGRRSADYRRQVAPNARSGRRRRHHQSLVVLASPALRPKIRRMFASTIPSTARACTAACHLAFPGGVRLPSCSSRRPAEGVPVAGWSRNQLRPPGRSHRRRRCRGPHWRRQHIPYGAYDCVRAKPMKSPTRIIYNEHQ